jgi:hypothetical protein
MTEKHRMSAHAPPESRARFRAPAAGWFGRRVARQRGLIIAVLLSSVPVSVTASGPPSTVGHLDIEPLSDRLRVTLQLPYSAVRKALGLEAIQSSDEFNQKLFLETLGEKPMLSNGKPCEWGKPVGIVSFVAVRIQSEAWCAEPPGRLIIELPFLESLSEDFRLGVKVHGKAEPASPEDMSGKRTEISLTIH